MTVMRVLLFVLHVCMLRECEGDGHAGVVVVSSGHVGGTRRWYTWFRYCV